MAESKRRRPAEEVIERWSREDDDDWGELDPTAVRLVHPPAPAIEDVAAVRRAIGMSQPEFAAAFGISIWTLRKWEQGVRVPHGPARALLKVIARETAAARRALATP